MWWFGTIFDLRFGLLAKFCAGHTVPDLQGRLGGELLAERVWLILFHQQYPSKPNLSPFMDIFSFSAVVQSPRCLKFPYMLCDLFLNKQF